MGGVLVRKGIYDAFMTGPSTSSNCSTATLIRRIRSLARPASPRSIFIATRGLFERARKLEAPWAQAAMGLKGLPNVLDIRPVGLTVGIDLASKPDAVGKRGMRRWTPASSSTT